MSKQMIDKKTRSALETVGMDTALTYFIEKLGNSINFAKKYENEDDFKHYSDMRGALKAARRKHRIYLNNLDSELGKLGIHR